MLSGLMCFGLEVLSQASSPPAVLCLSSDLPLSSALQRCCLWSLRPNCQGEVFDSPAPTPVVLSWTILSASGVPGSAAGHTSRVPPQHEREPTNTMRGIRLQFQQEPPALHSSQQQADLTEILPTHDVTGFNTILIVRGHF